MVGYPIKTTNSLSSSFILQLYLSSLPGNTGYLASFLIRKSVSGMYAQRVGDTEWTLLYVHSPGILQHYPAGTNVNIMKSFIGLILNIGHNRKSNINSYWDTKNPTQCIPIVSTTTVEMKKGDLLAVSWVDRAQVRFLSTNASSGTRNVAVRHGRHGEHREVPNVAIIYNGEMRRVDCNDQLVDQYATELKTNKLWRKVVFHLIDRCATDVRCYGPLDNISCFPHENMLGNLKKNEILQSSNLNVPKDPRTLLMTPKVSNIKETAGGSFYHFGVANGIVSKLSTPSCLVDVETLTLYINIDGLPLFGSSTGCIVVLKNQLIFVQEMKAVQKSGIVYNYKKYLVCLDAFICDAPAQAYVKCIKGHSGYNSCERCIQKGVHTGRVTFPEFGAKLLTDTEFNDMRDKAHHTGISPLKELGVGFVSQFVLDYMHLICLGIVWTILFLWMKGPLKSRFSANLLSVISRNLVDVRQSLPREFARKPKSLSEFKMWKATEFRQFLLYTGVHTGRVTFPEFGAKLRTDAEFDDMRDKAHHTGISPLKELGVGFVSQFVLDYMHLICLGIVWTILFLWMKGPLKSRFSANLLSVISRNLADVRQSLPREFARKPKSLSEFKMWKATEFRQFLLYTDVLVYNVHSLTHIVQDVRRYGPLDTISCFPYENMLTTVLKSVGKLSWYKIYCCHYLEKQLLFLLDNESHSDSGCDAHITERLASRAVGFRMSHSALSPLLEILQSSNLNVPKDPRTLLMTPKVINIKETAGGSFYHFGVANRIVSKLSTSTSPCLVDVETLTLYINIDGLSLFSMSRILRLMIPNTWRLAAGPGGGATLPLRIKRAKKPTEESWTNKERKTVNKRGVYCGTKKPTYLNKYLFDFVQEMKAVQKSGIVYNYKKYLVCLYAFICDAPARAYVKCIKGHSGYNSCERIYGSDVLVYNVHSLTYIVLDVGRYGPLDNISCFPYENMLEVLQSINLNVPKDPWILLMTPKVTSIKETAGGSFYHFGVANGIISKLSTSSCLVDVETSTLYINIDGLPLFGSSTGCIVVLKNQLIFVQEMKAVQKSGIVYNYKKYLVCLDAFICDAPAQAYVKCIKGHSGYNSCERCIQKGVHTGRVTFPEFGAKLLTDTEFNDMRDKAHHTGISPLKELGVGFVSQFVLDYMHLICLGIVRKIIFMWMKGPLKSRLSANLLSVISRNLADVRQSLPREFARKPRSLSELKCGRLQNSDNVLVYNVHSLTHIVQDVRRYGPLDNISCFPYEKMLGKLKKMVRRPQNPVAQIMRRIAEKDKFNVYATDCSSNRYHQKPPLPGPLPLQYRTWWQYKLYRSDKIFISCCVRDNCFEVDGKIVLVQNILLSLFGATSI
ncbi:PiggyBac transposable element-derived protein 4 [Nymphon striatum]|nr:PiggyBac transposable element-derived protein 4 [Nymphon striatum]